MWRHRLRILGRLCVVQPAYRRPRTMRRNMTGGDILLLAFIVFSVLNTWAACWICNRSREKSKPSAAAGPRDDRDVSPNCGSQSSSRICSGSRRNFSSDRPSHPRPVFWGTFFAPRFSRPTTPGATHQGDSAIPPRSVDPTRPRSPFGSRWIVNNLNMGGIP